MDKTKQLEGFFIEFNEEEIADVRTSLELQGYTTDCAGLKEYLLDNLFDEDNLEEETGNDTERIISKARKFVDENPATIKFGLDTIAGIAKMVGQKAARH